MAITSPLSLGTPFGSTEKERVQNEDKEEKSMGSKNAYKNKSPSETKEERQEKKYAHCKIIIVGKVVEIRSLSVRLEMEEEKAISVLALSLCC